MESRVWGQRHNGRGIRGIRHRNIYGGGNMWAAEHILCGFLQILKDSVDIGVWLAIGWWAGWGLVVRRSGREPPLPPRVARLPSRLQCGARLSAVRCRCDSICQRRTLRHRRTSRGQEQTHPLSAGHTAESRIRFGNTFSISSTLFRPSI